MLVSNRQENMFTLHFCLTFGFHPILNMFPIFITCQTFQFVAHLFAFLAYCGNLVNRSIWIRLAWWCWLWIKIWLYLLKRWRWRKHRIRNFCFMSWVSRREKWSPDSCCQASTEAHLFQEHSTIGRALTSDWCVNSFKMVVC